MDLRSPVPAARLPALGALAATALIAAGCGGAHPRAAADTVVNVAERDFTITASPGRVRAGAVVLHVRNNGPDAHELIVVRASRRGSLPLRSDGMTVREEALERSIVGTLEPGRPGAVRDLRVQLAPGRYVLLCNMSGHFMGGMSTVLEVS